MAIALPPVQALRQIPAQRGEAVVFAVLLDLPAIHGERAVPEPDEILNRDVQDVADVLRVIHARSFDVEMNRAGEFRVLQDDQQREILERLGVTEG